ncbi:MAG: Do family serine endopeptidase [Treponema sp.]|nr:Do family serine endopeptidase [Treponema sp.]
MKKIAKQILGAVFMTLLAVSAFADPPKKGSNTNAAAALSIVEAVQTTFRSISETMLPAVVEVHVTETKTVTYTDPFESFGFGGSPFDYFFGNPKQNGQEKNKERKYETSALGSGVIVRNAGNKYYVLTNNHVAGNASKITVTLNDGREFDAELVGADSRIDIALICFEAKDKSISVAKLGDSDEVHQGDLCIAFGAPLGYSQSMTQGIVSATGRSESHMSAVSDYIQTDAAINQGNSGGPLVNIYGEVIGINTWIASSSGGSVGLGFAIPINNVRDSIDAFISDGKITYGWLGVQLLDISKDESYTKELDVAGLDGAFASEVFLDSPAYKAGVKPGDYIVELNGKAVKSVNQLVRDVGGLKAGTTAKLTVIRGGKKLPELTVKIEARKSDAESQNERLWPGFIASPLTDKVRESAEITDKKITGVVVNSISEKSPAAVLNLQNGNIITAVNGVNVSNVKEFYAELSKATKTIYFDVYRNGGELTTGTAKIK